MDKAEQLEILRHWLAESRLAISDAAFIYAYEEVRQAYVRERKAEGKELGLPQLNPSGLVAHQRLQQARTTLVIFCGKAADRDKRSVGLRTLKNAILSDASLQPKRRDKIIQEFKQFDKEYGFEGEITDLRSKAYAHSDFDWLINGPFSSLKLRELLEHSLALTGLISTLRYSSELVPVVSHGNSFADDSTLTPGVYKFAHIYAVEFWTKNFAEWSSDADKPGNKP